MIKYKTLESVSLFPSGVATVGGGVQCAPKYSATMILCGLRARQEIQNGLGAHIRDGVATRMKPENTCTTTGFHGRYPEAVFTDRVRKLGMGFIWPTQPFGWPPCVFIFYYRLIIQLFSYYSWFAHISLLFLPTLHINPFNAFLSLTMSWQINKNNYKHTCQINGIGIRDYNFHDQNLSRSN